MLARPLTRAISTSARAHADSACPAQRHTHRHLRARARTYRHTHTKEPSLARTQTHMRTHAAQERARATRTRARADAQTQSCMDTLARRIRCTCTHMHFALGGKQAQSLHVLRRHLPGCVATGSVRRRPFWTHRHLQAVSFRHRGAHGNQLTRSFLEEQGFRIEQISGRAGL